MQFIIKVTHNGKVIRIPTDRKAGAEQLQKLLKLKGYTVDQRIYDYQGTLHREAEEVNAAARVLRAVVKG